MAKWHAVVVAASIPIGHNTSPAVRAPQLCESGHGQNKARLFLEHLDCLLM